MDKFLLVGILFVTVIAGCDTGELPVDIYSEVDRLSTGLEPEITVRRSTTVNNSFEDYFDSIRDRAMWDYFAESEQVASLEIITFGSKREIAQFHNLLFSTSWNEGLPEFIAQNELDVGETNLVDTGVRQRVIFERCGVFVFLEIQPNAELDVNDFLFYLREVDLVLSSC